jgi:hypothetical protein
MNVGCCILNRFKSFCLCNKMVEWYAYLGSVAYVSVHLTTF